jgi:hypothetical protein
MARGKSTITRDSVFKNTSQAKKPDQGVSEKEKAHQTALWLKHEEMDWVDEQCKTISRGGWRGVTRSAYIRALIQAAMSHPADLSGVSGEAELAQRLARK